MIGQRGRARKVGFVDGDLIPLAKITKFGNAKCITLPKEWLEIVEANGVMEYLSIQITIDSVILKPYRGEVGSR